MNKKYLGIFLMAIAGIYLVAAVGSIYIASHDAVMSNDEALSSSQNGSIISFHTFPNMDYVHYYNVTNIAPVDEYTIISVIETENIDGVEYSVVGNETRLVVPPMVTDYQFPITLHTSADSVVGPVSLRISNVRVA